MKQCEQHNDACSLWLTTEIQATILPGALTPVLGVVTMNQQRQDFEKAGIPPG
ncbi:hypothetical protein JR782_004600 [Salmonella enterica subsp. enterica serovar Eastbourne]|nr:hypothetical protein [Salmonella enterica subsp. enterica serovar Eastbourne]EHC5910011.1 hypothetical protein [Salmonella enterica subsp. enterica serovar Eastbourne]